MRSASDVQGSSAPGRATAYHSVEIGWSERKVALASKTPIHTARTCDAIHLSAKLAFQGRNPRNELKAETVVDHRKPAGSKRQALTVDPRDVRAWVSGQMRKPGLRGETSTDRIDFSLSKRTDEVAPDRHLVTVPPGQPPIGQGIDPAIKGVADLGAEALARELCRFSSNQSPIEPGRPIG